MKAIVSGLVNIETNVAVREFPIPYCPIEYSFFGVESGVGGVGYNVAKALNTLGDRVQLFSLTGSDMQAQMILHELNRCGIGTEQIMPALRATPESAVMYDEGGKRRICCDLKDIQEHSYAVGEDFCADADVFIMCNINFSRPLLRWAKAHNKTVATDVHTLRDINDEYNRDFMECADILFMSDENLPCEPQDFLLAAAGRYGARVIVMGRGGEGVMYIDRDAGSADDSAVAARSGSLTVRSMPAAALGGVVNTVGAGDALFSAFLHFYIGGMSAVQSLKRAQVFAALKIQKNGAANGFAGEREVEACLR